MHMVVAVLELETCRTVGYLGLAEGAVCLGQVEIALGRRVCFLEAHGEEAGERDDALLVLETEESFVVLWT